LLILIFLLTDKTLTILANIPPPSQYSPLHVLFAQTDGFMTPFCAADFSLLILILRNYLTAKPRNEVDPRNRQKEILYQQMPRVSLPEICLPLTPFFPAIG
jgi:hypothetical protein